MFSYPEIERVPKEQLHLPKRNPPIIDDYPYLEEPSDERTKLFVTQQNTLFKNFIESKEDAIQLKETMRNEIKNMLNSERIGNFFRRGNYIYFFRNSGLQNQDVLYQYPQKSFSSFKIDEARVFLDPNKFVEDGTSSLGTYTFTKNGQFLVFGIKEKGSDWQTLHVMNCETLERLGDQIPHCKFTSVIWKRDCSGFFYTRFPPASMESKNEYQSIYFHKIGDDWKEDACIYENKLEEEKHFMFGVSLTRDGLYLLIEVTNSCDPVNQVWFAPIDKPTEIQRFIDNFDHGFSYITNIGKQFYFLTNEKAPRYKVISIDIETKLKNIIIEEDKKDVLEFAVCTNEKYLLVAHLHNVHSTLSLHELETGKHIRDIDIPNLSTLDSISANWDYEEIFFKISSFTLPASVYQYNLKNDTVEQLYQTKINFNVDDIVTDQVWYSSKDGTQIPMFIIKKKDTVYNGNVPTFLYGYGGFNISLQPGFSSLRLFWVMHFGGIYCIPNIRGGGEFGEEWHKDGSLKKKQNTFDDFISASEYLISQGITQPEKLIIEGGSNGGLLIGACINQRPDLFGVAFPHVGVMDMLNFHRFTIGHAWISDYGNPESEEFFEILLKYSPLHSINSNLVYPAVLGFTAEQDDRVVPSHTLKWMARLQELVGRNEKQKKPLMLRVDTSAGHGQGNALSKRIEEEVDKYLFTIKVMDGLSYQ